MMFKTLATTLALGLLSIPAAQAAEVGSVSTATATIVVNNPGVVSHTLSAASSLLAGELAADTTVATGAVTISSQANSVGMRFTPGTCDAISGSVYQCTVSGTGDAGHKVDVKLESDGGGAVDGGNAWFVTTATGDQGYSVKTLSAQTVAADSFNLSVDTVEWQN
jgi:hypothetical protein